MQRIIFLVLLVCSTGAVQTRSQFNAQRVQFQETDMYFTLNQLGDNGKVLKQSGNLFEPQPWLPEGTPFRESGFQFANSPTHVWDNLPFPPANNPVVQTFFPVPPTKSPDVQSLPQVPQFPWQRSLPKPFEWVGKSVDDFWRDIWRDVLIK